MKDETGEEMHSPQHGNSLEAWKPKFASLF